MVKIPENQKSAISNIIAPSALFWFRWSAMATIIFGIMLAYFQGYIVEAFTLSETHWGIRFNNDFSPNYFEKLSDLNIKFKKKSFLKYKSQIKKFPHPRSIKGIETLANFRGMQIGSEYAEAFEVKLNLNL